ncbi:MAG: hypothetical protein ACSHYA_02550 [Opitutaceae bacterium]
MKEKVIDFIGILENQDFDSLSINRVHGMCYLIVEYQGNKHVLTDEKGRRKEYRHAWQIKQWLAERYGLTHVAEILVH